MNDKYLKATRMLNYKAAGIQKLIEKKKMEAAW